MEGNTDQLQGQAEGRSEEVEGEVIEDQEVTEPRTALVEIDDDGIHELMKYCDDDYISNFELTNTEILKLKKQLAKTVLDDNVSVPMICEGDACIFDKSCPLVAVNKPPIGKKCAVEMMMLHKWRDEYVKSLQIDWNDKVDRKLACELLELDIMGARANEVLGDDGFIMENVVGMNEQTGAPITRKEKHIALDVKDMVYKRRSKVLQELIATREAKAKFMQDLRGDPSVYAAQLRKKAEELRDGSIIEASSIEPMEDDDVKSETREANI